MNQARRRLDMALAGKPGPAQRYNARLAIAYAQGLPNPQDAETIIREAQKILTGVDT
ncbi:hypothetical protein PBI_GAIA_164 [Mycobacterium phage Gaia]|uniref:Uncharacterized protein n=1 Tax=Mycobacterium phage Gaia TaxID=1486472 RepID=A0A068F8Y9_9CAUD|nr:hypothetical protein VC46_gp072 [Mycobacterium phage Gaia]AID58980.1 hypothetical protein PBI_GAIA_164 [Mycobacterium phage Gaia]AYR00089.1 hypothetical protein PBI_NEBKISS_160 [Mycobacterium phage Nebkiss]